MVALLYLRTRDGRRPMSNEAMREALTDDEIAAIRKWMPVIDPMTQADYSTPWADSIKFARVIESCARNAAIEASAREAQDTADNYYHQTGKNAANDCAARIRRLKEGE